MLSFLTQLPFYSFLIDFKMKPIIILSPAVLSSETAEYLFE